MIEYLRTTCISGLLSERMNEIAARGWTITSVAVASRTASQQIDTWQIDATRDALLYVETPEGPHHRDDIFFRLSRLDPASRSQFLRYLSTLEANRKIADAPPHLQPQPAATVPPPLPPGKTIARAVGGTEVPNDAEALTLQQREASVQCVCCGGSKTVAVEIDPEDGIDVDSVTCPACNGVGELSRRVVDQFEQFKGRYAERARQTAKTMTKQARKRAAAELAAREPVDLDTVETAQLEAARLEAEAAKLRQESAGEGKGEASGG